MPIPLLVITAASGVVSLAALAYAYSQNKNVQNLKKEKAFLWGNWRL